MTATLSKIIWLAFGIVWFVLRLRPGQRSRKTPVRYSARGAREFVLLGASLTGLGIVPWSFTNQPFVLASGPLPFCGSTTDFFTASYSPVIDLTQLGGSVYVN